jgi:hypothetical protein
VSGVELFTLLAGLQLGASLTHADHDLSPHFRLGAGLDLLASDGLFVSTRLDATHEIDATLALMAGWAGQAHRSDSGFPLALAVGGAIALDRLGNPRGGGRGLVSLSLWSSRATLELDVTVVDALTPSGRFLRGTEPEVAVGLAIRLVPWAPWTL